VCRRVFDRELEGVSGMEGTSEPQRHRPTGEPPDTPSSKGLPGEPGVHGDTHDVGAGLVSGRVLTGEAGQAGEVRDEGPLVAVDQFTPARQG
jgi:hypothetical protein